MDGWSRLSEKQQTIARLVAQGYSNRGIANMLSCSPQQIAKELSDIYAELEITVDEENRGMISPRVLTANYVREREPAIVGPNVKSPAIIEIPSQLILRPIDMGDFANEYQRIRDIDESAYPEDSEVFLIMKKCDDS